MSELIPYRDHHILQILTEYEESDLPLDLTIHQHYKAHKSLGSKDRAVVSETVYSLIRWKLLLDHIAKDKNSWPEKLELVRTGKIEEATSNIEHPLHVRFSFPEFLFKAIVDSHGEERAHEICLACNVPAPTTVRVNTLKTTRDELLKKWQPLYQVVPNPEVETGITFEKKIALFALPEFKDGLFEVQDAGSQVLAAMVQAKPGQQVMDYCSGSGGKALAIAPAMKQQGQLYLHDIRPKILIEAKRRLKRAGIQNAQIVQADDDKLKKLKKKMDWVLVDAPCSGTGTLRRNPDMKWRLDESAIARLVSQQRVIFERALSYLAPGGTIVYSTCSLLTAENQDQMKHFMETYKLKLVGEPFQSLPKPGLMDGFFAVAFTR